jgi:hypothetical protein
MEKPLLDFHDALIYQRDIQLFHDGNWINDSCINFCFRFFEFTLFQNNRNILFMDPAVVSCIKIQDLDEDDIAQLNKGLRISTRDIILVPCNDNSSFDSSSSHWSLLAIDCFNKISYHFDSYRPHNSISACDTLLRLNLLLKWYVNVI